MSERARRLLAGGVTVALALVVAVGLATAPRQPADRVEALASRLRCPVCQGESVADSPSETAQGMRRIIEEQVEQGRSDQEILSYFVSSYTEWVLLDPPPAGRTLLLWALPALALAVGLVLIVRRRRTGGDRPAAEIPLHPAPRSRRRALAGSVLLLAAFAAVTLVAVRAVGPRPEGGFVTGNPAEAAEQGRDLSQVTNEEMEEVVAANPEVVGMRLALANRYFEEGQFSEALDHYFGVLERQPDSAQALARIGWMAYLSGEAEAAASYEREALAIDPGYAEAKWFLANIRLDGLGDRQGAIELLEELAALPDLSGDVRAMVEERLAEARRSADG